MNSTQEIERCPFCGAEADVQDDFGSEYWVQCSDIECGSTDGTVHANPNDAIKHWNRRSQSREAQPFSSERDKALNEAAAINPNGLGILASDMPHVVWMKYREAILALKSTPPQQSEDERDGERFRAFVGAIVAEHNGTPQTAIRDELSSHTEMMTLDSVRAAIDTAISNKKKGSDE
jgi:hypothetical protein